MGCCGCSMFVLIVCSLQLLFTVERLVLDFIAFLYFSMIVNLIQITLCIICIFGLCLYRWKFVLAYLIWQVLYIVWNIFAICLYVPGGAGSLTESDYKIMSFGTSKSWWLQQFDCSQSVDCVLSGNIIEVLHAAVHLVLSIIGCVAASFVVLKLREKDETDPRGYKSSAANSRQASLSRNGTLPHTYDNWLSGSNNRDSIRSTRSTRSRNHVDHVRPDNTVADQPHRQSKRRSSSRSNKSKRSVGPPEADGDMNRPHRNSKRGSQRSKRRPASQTNIQLVPIGVSGDDSPGMPRFVQEITIRGHDNESFGYNSSSDYNDVRSPHHGPGFQASDLPPPLEEGPEAYSRDGLDQAGLPPPPLGGPEPYSDRKRRRSSSHLNNSSSAPGRSSALQLTPIDHAARVGHRDSQHKAPLSASEPSSDEDSDNKSGLSSSPNPTPESTPVKSLYAAPKKNPTPQHQINGLQSASIHQLTNLAIREPMGPTHSPHSNKSSSHYPRSDTESHRSYQSPPDSEHPSSNQPFQPSAAGRVPQQPVFPPTHRSPHNPLNKPADRTPTSPIYPVPSQPMQLPRNHDPMSVLHRNNDYERVQKPNNGPLPQNNPNRHSTDLDDITHSQNLRSPTERAPIKDNTFMRMVTGNKSNRSMARSVQPDTHSSNPPTSASSTPPLKEQPPSHPTPYQNLAPPQPAQANLQHPTRTNLQHPTRTNLQQPTRTNLSQPNRTNFSQPNRTNLPVNSLNSPYSSKPDIAQPNKVSPPASALLAAGSVPPWERSSQRRPTSPYAGRARDPSNPQFKPNESLTEVTSSYGGLYSSNRTPPTRRRLNMAQQQSHPIAPPDKVKPKTPNIINATDDSKSSGSFISSSALMI